MAGRLGSWAFWSRPRSYWTVVVYHLPLAVLTGVALFLPYAVTVGRPLSFTGDAQDRERVLAVAVDSLHLPPPDGMAMPLVRLYPFLLGHRQRAVGFCPG